MIRLALVPRQTFRDWQRDRLVQISAELHALRLDLGRLQKRAIRMGRCDQCKRGATIFLQLDGWWRCRTCVDYVKEAHA